MSARSADRGPSLSPVWPHRMDRQQSVLPFVLQGRAVAASPGHDGAMAPPSARPATVTPKRTSAMGATYSVAVAEFSASELEAHKRALTMTPIETGYGPANGPTASFDAYEIHQGRIHVPRFYGFKEWGPAADVTLSLGEALTCADAPFAGTLNPVQTAATRDTIDQLERAPHGALLVLPCGYGKTVCALWVAHALKRRTLVLVHKAFLVSQWHERANHFLPGASVGRIQQNVVEGDADIVVGMVHSIAKRDYPEEMLRGFGTVIIDEAHHMSAPFFSRALRKPGINARHILGLSATPERKDGLTNLLYHSMGDIAHRIERTPEHTLVSCLVYENQKRREITYRDGRVSMPLMLNALASDPVRNRFIAGHIVRCMRAGRHVIVLTDRLAQLHDLRGMLLAEGIAAADIAYYVGSTPREERERAEGCPCILSTYSMAKEGLDIPRLDTLVMATPKGDVVQASGRVQRKHSKKHVPLIIDVVDSFSIFEALRWKRCNFYRKEQFRCQTYQIGADADDWFV